MELSQLRALVSLQELASLARVGEQLHLSPSAVFCQIRQLEEETGHKMYERVGKTLHLTSAGQELALHAQKILASHDAALLALKAQSRRREGILRLGCGPHNSARIAPYLLQAFLQVHPGFEVRLETAEDEFLVRDVRLGVLDAAMMGLPTNDEELGEDPLWSYEYVFALPRTGLIAKRMPTLADIRQAPFIRFHRTALVDSHLKRLWFELGFEPNVVIENDQVDSIKVLVRLGFGVTLLPLPAVDDEVKSGSLRMVRMRRPVFHNYGLIYRRAGSVPKVVADLRTVAHDWKHWWPHAASVQPPIA